MSRSMQQNKYTPLKFSLRLHNLRNLMEIQTSRFLESDDRFFTLFRENLLVRGMEQKDFRRWKTEKVPSIY